MHEGSAAGEKRTQVAVCLGGSRRPILLLMLQVVIACSVLGAADC